METVREVREEMTCEHGEPADTVCGACGVPVCQRGSDRVRDAALSSYESGWRTLGVALLLIVGVPAASTQLFPEPLGRIMLVIFDKAMYLRKGLVPASVLLGVALLPTLRVRNGETFQLLTRRTGERTVCADCKGQFQRQQAVAYAMAGLGALVALYGVYRMWDLRQLGVLWYVGLGAGLYVVRTEVALLVDRVVA